MNAQRGSYLRELGVSGLAIIESVRVEFGEGLTVLTGETGAGKSLLVDALALARGGRGDSSAVRAGSDRLRVELQIKALGQEHIAVREVYAEGRSVARLDDELVTVGRLAAEMGPLIDIHGQHDQQRLGDPGRQRDLLDRWSSAEEQRAVVSDLIQRRTALLGELQSLGGSDSRRQALAEVARSERDDLEAAAIRVGEEAELREELRRASNIERISALYDELREALNEERSGLRARASAIERSARELAKLDTTNEPLAERLSALAIEVDDLGREVAGLTPFSTSVRSLSEIEERMTLLLALQRRFRTDEAGLLNALEQARAEVERLDGAEARRTQITAELTEVTERIGESAAELRRLRLEGAATLSTAVNTALTALELPPSFAITLEQRAGVDGDPIVHGTRCAVDQAGGDEVCYVFAPNIGEPAGPIARIASGGELSRVSLAIEEALSDASESRTLVFDEIDAGLGGRAGETLGQSLRRIATHHQVLCVTHLPQVAAHADTHLRVSKHEVDGRTVTQVRRLSDDERVTELAAMLAGDGAGSGAAAAAAELLANAKHSR
ncbi:MAG: AAA family ATPase [Chloroflexi bacterium]|nr:AAA family ATPase [Chloroflexota bacterium]